MLKFLILSTVAALCVQGTPSLSASHRNLRIARLSGVFQSCSTPAECEAEAKAYLEGVYEEESSRLCREAVNADFEYNIDLNNPDKEQAVAEANIAYSNFIFKSWNETIKNWEHDGFTDESIKRQLQFLNVVGTAALDETDLKRYNEILGQMANIYGTAKICPFDNQNCNPNDDGLYLEPDIEAIISTSRNSEELAYVWKAWRDASGAPIQQLYREYIALSNKAAVANGMPDNGDLWLNRYESPDFRDQVKAVWSELQELYAEVYAYVRYKLRQQYPSDIPLADSPIPAHILGNMWAQTWEGIYELVKPFSDAPGFDVTEKLKEAYGNEGYDAAFQMFEEANKFFMGLGLADMKTSYGEKAMIVRPEDGRAVTCHASAWDFCDGTDYRIKMCTNVNQEDFVTIHHELGHIQYFIKYNQQPITFRDGANPGFHEAIGDVLALSVATPKHMFKLGFVDSPDLNNETIVNFLMQKALEKIAFLPFGYLIDAYRWRLFDGSITEDQMEYEWLKIRNEIEGIVPPVMRSEADFDAGAKYHVPGNTPYIRYFVSFIIQFQIHKQLCIAANQYDPANPSDPQKLLFNCDIDGSPEAGAIMDKLLTKGFAENWQDILEEAIGTREMDPNAIKEYFTPLTDYLLAERTRLGYPATWNASAFEAYYTPSVREVDEEMELRQETSSSSTATEEPEDDKIKTSMIIVGIIQGGGIVVVAVIYVIKTFILKR